MRRRRGGGRGDEWDGNVRACGASGHPVAVKLSQYERSLALRRERKRPKQGSISMEEPVWQRNGL